MKSNRIPIGYKDIPDVDGMKAKILLLERTTIGVMVKNTDGWEFRPNNVCPEYMRRLRCESYGCRWRLKEDAKRLYLQEAKRVRAVERQRKKEEKGEPK